MTDVPPAGAFSVGPRAGACLAFMLPVATAILFRAMGSALALDRSSDYAEFYEPTARSLLAGSGATLPDGSPMTTYPPGYPIILATLFQASSLLRVPEAGMIQAFILACNGAAGLALHALARLVWSPLAALVPVAAWAVYPPALWLTLQPNVELPFAPLVLTSLYVASRLIRSGSRSGWSHVGLGALVGAAMLIKPIAIGLGVMAPLSVAILSKGTARRRLALAACVVLGNVAVIAPWELWMASRTGEVHPLSSNGAAAVRDGLIFAVDPTKPYRQGIPVPPDVRAFMKRAEAQPLDTIDAILRMLGDELTQRPATVVKLFLIKGGRAWYGTDSQRLETQLLVVQLGFLAIGAVAALRAWRFGGTLGHLTCAGWTVILYFWAMTMMVLPIARYLTPVVGLAFLPLPILLAPALFAPPRRGEPERPS